MSGPHSSDMWRKWIRIGQNRVVLTLQPYVRCETSDFGNFAFVINCVITDDCRPCTDRFIGRSREFERCGMGLLHLSTLFLVLCRETYSFWILLRSQGFYDCSSALTLKSLQELLLIYALLLVSGSMVSLFCSGFANAKFTGVCFFLSCVWLFFQFDSGSQDVRQNATFLLNCQPFSCHFRANFCVTFKLVSKLLAGFWHRAIASRCKFDKPPAQLCQTSVETPLLCDPHLQGGCLHEAWWASSGINQLVPKTTGWSDGHFRKRDFQNSRLLSFWTFSLVRLFTKRHACTCPATNFFPPIDSGRIFFTKLLVSCRDTSVSSAWSVLLIGSDEIVWGWNDYQGLHVCLLIRFAHLGVTFSKISDVSPKRKAMSQWHALGFAQDNSRRELN